MAQGLCYQKGQQVAGPKDIAARLMEIDAGNPLVSSTEATSILQRGQPKAQFISAGEQRRVSNARLAVAGCEGGARAWDSVAMRQLGRQLLTLPDAKTLAFEGAFHE